MKNYNHEETSVDKATGTETRKVISKVGRLRNNTDSVSLLAEAIEEALTVRELAVFSALTVRQLVDTAQELEVIKGVLGKGNVSSLSLSRDDVPKEFQEKLDEIMRGKSGELTKDIVDQVPGLKDFLLGRIKDKFGDKCDCPSCSDERITGKINEAFGGCVLSGDEN